MLFDFNRYSALLLVFFVHGLVYAGLLARRALREERSSDGWLAFFLFLCVIHISPWMLGFAGWYDTQPYRDFLFYTPMQHLYALGPAVFFYVQSLLNPSFRFTRREAVHFVPAALYLVFSIVVWLTDKVILHRYWFLAGGEDLDFATAYQLTGFASMLLYALAALRYYRLYRRLMLQVTSFADRIRFDWVRPFLLAFGGMLVLRVCFYALSLAGWDNYSDSWWYYLGFALIFYYIAIRGYGNHQAPPVAFRALVSEQRAVLLLPAAGPAGQQLYVAEDEAIAVDDEPPTDPWLETPVEADLILVELWRSRLEALMRDEAPWKDPELSLTALARRLGLPAAQLSRVVNRGFECNFNDFVNRYRVQAVQSAIAAGEHQRQTLVGIAYDCGFNSKATFNRSFLKIAGQTPKAFAEQNQ